MPNDLGNPYIHSATALCDSLAAKQPFDVVRAII